MRQFILVEVVTGLRGAMQGAALFLRVDQLQLDAYPSKSAPRPLHRIEIMTHREASEAGCRPSQAEPGPQT